MMSKNRYNKPARTVPDFTPRGKKEEVEIKLNFTPCLVCGKQITAGYYGRYNDGGVCSKKCDTIQDAKPRNFGEPNEKDLHTSVFNGVIVSQG